jgi:fatty acid desaturase
MLKSVQAAGLLQREYVYYALKIGLTFAAIAGAWVGFAFIGDSWAQLGIAAVLGIFYTQILFISHQAAHRQIFRTNSANEWTAMIMGVLFGGVSLAWWHNKHNTHHAKPNQVGKDPDIDSSVVHFFAPASPVKNPVLRWLHQRQGNWFFPLLVVEALNLHVQSVQFLVTKPKVKRRWTELTFMAIRLGGYPALLFVLLPAGLAGAFLGVQLAVTGVYLGAMFAASHIGMLILPHDAKVDFFRRQVLTSRNVRGGRFINWLMGGLNLQIEHHLFPNIAGPNVHAVQPIVRRFCAQNDITYHEVSLFGAWAIVVRYMNAVGLRAPGIFVCPVVASLRPR